MLGTVVELIHRHPNPSVERTIQVSELVYSSLSHHMMGAISVRNFGIAPWTALFWIQMKFPQHLLK